MVLGASSTWPTAQTDARRPAEPVVSSSSDPGPETFEPTSEPILKGAAMSERIDQFADGLGERLSKIETMIDAAKIGLREAKVRDWNDLDSTSHWVRHQFEAAKHVAKTAEASVTGWVKAKEASHASVVQGSGDESASSQLERQAASAEDDAEAGLSLAEVAIVNAVNASYEAIDAQRAAERPKAS